MKILIPNQITDTDLTDGEAMLIALMNIICNTHGYDQWYNMNAGDWRKILFPAGATNPRPFGPKTKNIRNHLRFCQLDDKNILIKFINVRPKAKGAYDTVGTIYYELKDIRSIQIWCYLMGLWFGENDIISEATCHIEYETNFRSKSSIVHRNFLVG